MEWCRPDHGWIKINFDFGVNSNTNLLSFRAVAHNAGGEVCGWSYETKVGALDSYDGELLALAIAMKCGLYKKWPRVVFEGDNRVL